MFIDLIYKFIIYYTSFLVYIYKVIFRISNLLQSFYSLYYTNSLAFSSVLLTNRHKSSGLYTFIGKQRDF